MRLKLKKVVTIKNPTGLHLRPAGELYQTTESVKIDEGHTFLFDGGIPSNAKGMLRHYLSACVKAGMRLN